VVQQRSFLAGLPHLHVFTLPAQACEVTVAPMLETVYNKSKNIVSTFLITSKVLTNLNKSKIVC